MNLYSKQELEKMWEELGEIPINEKEEIELKFLSFPVGTHREDIWLWFDEQYEVDKCQ